MVDRQIKVDIKQAFYDLANEIEKECGDWKGLPEDKELTNRILAAVMEYTNNKEKTEMDKDYKRTRTYSEFIVDTVEYFDRRIEQLNEGSVNKLRLHNSLHMCLILKVKKIVNLSPEKTERALDDLFKTELTNEVMKLRRERVSEREMR